MNQKAKEFAAIWIQWQSIQKIRSQKWIIWLNAQYHNPKNFTIFVEMKMQPMQL